MLVSGWTDPDNLILQRDDPGCVLGPEASRPLHPAAVARLVSLACILASFHYFSSPLLE